MAEMSGSMGKRTYEAPALTRIAGISEVTLSGVGSGPGMMNMMGMGDMSMMKPWWQLW